MSSIGPAPYLALAALLAVGAQILAWRLKIPSILLLLLVVFGLGQGVSPEDVLGRDVLFAGVTLAVGVILFEGSLSLRLREIADLGRPVVRLCTVTVAVAWAGAALAAWAVGVRWELALLVGAILVVTGPTVIAPILRMLRPTRRVSALLRWEGIVVDPLGAILGLLVFQAVVAGGRDGTAQALVTTLGTTVVVATAIAAALGILVEQLIVRHVVPDHLQGVACLAAALASLTLSNAVQAESGLLSVTLLGLYLGNRPHLDLHHVKEFAEHLQVLLVGVLFVILAGRVRSAELLDVLLPGVAFVALLVVVVRPVSVLVGLAGTDTTRAERSLLARMAPRGIVAAAVTSIFALELEHEAEEAAHAGDARAGELAGLAADAAGLVPLVFLVIVLTVALYGLGVGRMAERLGLASTSPQGVLFAGGPPWAVQAAQRLEEEGIPCLVVARDYRDLAGARTAGLRAVTANILSDYAVRDMDLAGIGHFVATTPEDEVNATAAREFAQVLGRVHVFQLQRAEHAAGVPAHGGRRAPAAHLTARTPFEPPLTPAEMDQRTDAGWRVTRTRLTDEFGVGDLREVHGADAVLLFVVRSGRLDVVTDRTRPSAGDAVVALVPPRTDSDGPQ